MLAIYSLKNPQFLTTTYYDVEIEMPSFFVALHLMSFTGKIFA